jgi:uncharacterized protein (DUF1015 family)
MPSIKPFKALLPNNDLAQEIVVHLENLTIENAKIIRDQSVNSFVHLLIPKLEHYYLQGSKQELAFKKIAENLEDFMRENVLIQDDKSSLYIYQIKHLGLTQTGIWTVTAIDDYLNNTVKKHELTRVERERGLIEYLQQTGIDANPVLITYPPKAEINQIIETKVKLVPDLSFDYEQEQHHLWKVNDSVEVDKLVQLFEKMDATYLADGHHRAAAACTYGIERRKLNLKHKATEEYNFFSSVYMSTDQLRVFEFHRVIKDLGNLSSADFLKAISSKFNIQEIKSEDLNPKQEHQFGLYHAGKSYLLITKSEFINPANVVGNLDVSILEDLILKPILNILDSRTDKRISFAGGITQIYDLLKSVDSKEQSAVFFLYPTSIDDLMKVADLGETMPPKSTWFEPKFLVGLVTHLIN